MNKQSDDAKWQGKMEAIVSNLTSRIGRLEKFIGGLVLGLAALYLRSLGILP